MTSKVPFNSFVLLRWESLILGTFYSAGKPGRCPSGPPSSICPVMCKHDGDCPGKQKCCRYGCMVVCKDPV
uniref:WAP domain-containing protein n=1 Tax=Pseudonaja textilis TaxID=8673 RepID=A0A670ZQN6_PSETE